MSAEEIVMRIRSPRTRFFNVVPFLLAVFLIAVPMNRLGATGSSTPMFLPVVTYDTGGDEASSVVIADVNGDRKPDLVVVNCGGCYGPPSITHPGSLAVMLGNGDGTFQKAVTYSSGGVTPLSVAVADLNGDGKPDLVVANRCGNNGCLNESTVGVLIGNGDGTFQSALTYGSGGLFSSSVVVADVNGDGRADLLIANDCADSNCDGSVGVLLGNGDGSFQAALTYATGGLEGFAVAAVDVNGDGRPDIIVGTDVPICAGGRCTFPGSLGVLLGNGDGSFQPAVTYLSGGFLPRSIAVADINGDGKPDIVVENLDCCLEPDGVTGVLLGNGDGTFKTAVTYTLGVKCGGTSVAVADVNGDGQLDLIVTDQCTRANGANEGVVGVFLGNGDGTFQAGKSYSAGGFLTNSVTVADLNGDGKPDLVVANLCADNSSVCAQTSVGVLLNNAQTFCTTPPVITLSTTPMSLWPPSGKMMSVTVSGAIADTGCSIKSASFAVTDEYGKIQPKGTVTLRASGAYSFSILLQASRLGIDKDGRRYVITVVASDNAGNIGSKTTAVTVPHDQRH
jgi:hypothetical protein